MLFRSAGEVVDLAMRPDVRIVTSLNPQGEGAPYLPLIGIAPPPPDEGGDEAEEPDLE